MSTVVFEELNGVGRIGLNRGAQHNALGKAEGKLHWQILVPIRAY